MIDVDDSDAERILCDSKAEAIAVATAGMEPGDEITVHDEDCAIDEETLDGCTCEPQVLVIGEVNEA